MQATCNACEEVTDIRFIEAQRPLGIKETYFRCNNCNEHYTCFVTNTKIRSMQKEVGKRRASKEDVLDEQEEVGRLMNALKDEFEANRLRKGGE